MCQKDCYQGFGKIFQTFRAGVSWNYNHIHAESHECISRSSCHEICKLVERVVITLALHSRKGLCQVPIDAITDYHTMGGLKKHTFIILQFVHQKSDTGLMGLRSWWGGILLWSSMGEYLSLFSPASGGYPTFLGSWFHSSIFQPTTN